MTTVTEGKVGHMAHGIRTTLDLYDELKSQRDDLLEALKLSEQYLVFAVSDSKERGYVIAQRTAERDLETVRSAIQRAEGGA